MAMDAERNIEVQFRVETLGDEAFAAHVIKIKEPLATIRADVKDFEAVKRFMKTTAESRANIADNLRFLSRLAVNDGDYTQAIKTARLRSMRLMLINAGEEYKFAKLSCEYGFSVAQATFGGGSDIELTEDQKRRLESAKKRNASSNEVGFYDMNSDLRNIEIVRCA